MSGALALYEAQRRGLLEAIRNPILTTSLNGRITGFNAAAIALFGSPARVYGRHVRELMPFVSEPREPGNAEAQGRIADATGRTLDVEVGRTVLADDDSGYAVYVVHDISRHAEINRLREQLLYSVSHELRGPLMVLDNALEILEGEFASFTHEEFEHVLSTARRAAARMRTLMEDLLSAGSIQSGKFAVAPRRAQLAGIVAEALEMQRSLLAMRGQELEVSRVNAMPPVLADTRYARQVLTNLLSNASKYSPEGSKIRLVAATTGKMVRVSVEDQGPGIAPEQQTGLFERFYRVRTDTEAPGVGLGLAIAKGIVEAHGGSIGIDSVPGRGTSVWFTLPRAVRPA
jgi:two-component system, OmpR family, phosphate regulon sensor histidine kinase PhoR